MSWILFKKPNGKYCIWDNTIDEFLKDDLSKSDVINAYVNHSIHKAIYNSLSIIEQVDDGIPQAAFTYEDCLDFLKGEKQ